MKKIEQLLLNRIHEARGMDALQLQIGGQLFAGAVKQSSIEGLYEILIAGQHQNGQMIAVKCIFAGEDLEAIFEPHEENVIKPRSGIIIPGAE